MKSKDKIEKFFVEDLHNYLIGKWKRSLDWREFGNSFSSIKTSNTVVVVEEFHRMDSPNTRYLKWNFGRGVEKDQLYFGYVMKIVSEPKSNETLLEWEYSGTPCHGKFIHTSGLMVLNFFLLDSSVIVTYKAIDENTMSVCIVECDSKKMPTIQYGNMIRLDMSLYSHTDIT